jgi:NAD-dependent DNA ligase
MNKVPLQGDGSYAVPIVGESRHQEVLEELSASNRGTNKVTASLILEDTNPHDPNAVRVEVNHKHVGYLSREMAKVYRARMIAAGHSGAVGTCQAIIKPPNTQGERRSTLLDRFSVGDMYEIFLDLFDDATMHTILAELSKDAIQVNFDSVQNIEFSGARFCLTGTFSRPKDEVKAAIESHGAEVVENVSKKVRFLVVGKAGSADWKHGSFGTKLEKAKLIKQQGSTLSIISEDQLAAALREGP